MNIADSVVAEPAWHRAAWTWVVVLLTVAALLAALAGCAGTDIKLTGEVCGQNVDLVLHDAKDRDGFDAKVECPIRSASGALSGGGLTITSTKSSTSAVMIQQAALIDKLTNLVTTLVAAGSGVSLEQRAAIAKAQLQ
jgi:hypothetical protein